MYLNTIKFKGSKISEFLTHEEIFTPYNPVYKKVQETLEKMGWKPSCNHVFSGNMGDLHFTHTEIDVYCPKKKDLDWVWENRKDTLNILSELEYIFSNQVSAEHVEKILK
jgi:hypothetical protein